MNDRNEPNPTRYPGYSRNKRVRILLLQHIPSPQHESEGIVALVSLGNNMRSDMA